jgi:hypothetical protein
MAVLMTVVGLLAGFVHRIARQHAESGSVLPSALTHAGRLGC